jgi:hypothetical protein
LRKIEDKKLPANLCAIMIGMARNQKSNRAISKELGVSRITVEEYFDRCEEVAVNNGSFSRRTEADMARILAKERG